MYIITTEKVRIGSTIFPSQGFWSGADQKPLTWEDADTLDLQRCNGSYYYCFVVGWSTNDWASNNNTLNLFEINFFPLQYTIKNCMWASKSYPIYPKTAHFLKHKYVDLFYHYDGKYACMRVIFLPLCFANRP